MTEQGFEFGLQQARIVFQSPALNLLGWIVILTGIGVVAIGIGIVALTTRGL